MKKIVVRHFHDGNDPNHEVRGTLPGKCAIYATQASVLDLETNTILAQEWSFCNPCDSPSRAIGRMKAVRQLQGRNPDICKGAKYGTGIEYLDPDYVPPQPPIVQPISEPPEIP